ncbi:curli production assembly/transport protein CsgG [Simiduia sp. 21SJ11W-1]|uniref:CsgG/HfaB family protein n=1 Tax=Simiduia sp. 21SJ11W-1 TaxID=2909669 RepID=UPI00209E20C0|nr:CsgG/HfaB family protein [Simiduia sp. 21SJ11W-1]UTA47390.1 curli production assembly/transport protein CsgG [Simiduia sp. 21SJ11W-1]
MLTQTTRMLLASCALLLTAGCETAKQTETALFGPAQGHATLTPRARTYQDLTSLPAPRGKIVATVYNVKDQTGQYKPMPASSFSTAVSQGATAMLVNAMNDSGWFIPLEREGLQNLLTERKIIRAALKKPNTPQNNDDELPSLLAANVLIEGAIVAYESNLKTGGAGARYFGIGASEQYRVDKVTVNLRAIDIRSGRILHSIMTSKSILSREISGGVFRFVEYKRLLEIEAGTTTNEPAQMCVLSALEAGLIHLIADGIRKNSWSLANPNEINNPTLAQYLNQTPEIL